MIGYEGKPTALIDERLTKTRTDHRS
jgi:hypothetical protein